MLRLTKQEFRLMEGYIFFCLYKRIRRLCADYLKTYAPLLIMPTHEKNNDKYDRAILRFVIHDIVMTEEFTLEGIAHELKIPYDIIFEIAAGININPSWQVVIKLFQLHNRLRPGFYDELIRKLLLPEAETS